MGKLLEGTLRQEGRVELHKLYCQWRQTAWLLTFRWHQIERELLEEQLLEGSEQHCLQEDILSRPFIQLHRPSPFLKKTAHQQRCSHEEGEEEYL